MSEITTLGQQLAKIITDCNKTVEYLNGVAMRLKQNSEVAQHLMQSTVQRNCQTLISNLSSAQTSLSNAALNLNFVADTATKWLNTHVGGVPSGTSSNQQESIAFPEATGNNTEKTQNEAEVTNLFSRPDQRESSQQYASIVNALAQRNVEHRNIELYGRERTEEEIIAQLGGRDRTKGSCSSLAFAYAGNKAGYNVLDFRDGDSRSFFSKDKHIEMIADLPTVNSCILHGKDEIECANQLLQKMIPDKEYYLATGCHAAIVKKHGDQFLYLELQSAYSNGWHLLSDGVLQERFHCNRDFAYVCPSFLIELGSLSESSEFLDILGYLNTAELD